MAYRVMAYEGMAQLNHGVYSCGIHTYGVHSYGVYIHAISSYGSRDSDLMDGGGGAGVRRKTFVRGRALLLWDGGMDAVGLPG